MLALSIAGWYCPNQEPDVGLCNLQSQQLEASSSLKQSVCHHSSPKEELKEIWPDIYTNEIKTRKDMAHQPVGAGQYAHLQSPTL